MTKSETKAETAGVCPECGYNQGVGIKTSDGDMAYSCFECGHVWTEGNCDRPGCTNDDQPLKACRGPEDNLLDLCPRCRREWGET